MCTARTTICNSVYILFNVRTFINRTQRSESIATVTGRFPGQADLRVFGCGAWILLRATLRLGGEYARENTF